MLNRPKTFNQFIGMNKLKKILKIIIASSLKRKEPLDHILLYGPPGLGKTSMAYLIGKYSKQNIKYINGNIIEKKSDILSVFANIKENDLIFIDEIHAVNKQIEELLFSAMEDNVIDILIGVESEAKIVRFKLKPFTLLGATTKFGKMSNALLDRFGFSWKFEYYSNKDIGKILSQYANENDFSFDNDALELLIPYTKNIPRTAKTITKRIFDFMIVHDKKIITSKIIYKTLNLLQIYKDGLNQHHINHLLLLRDVFKQKPTGLSIISNVSKESKINIETQIEPILMQLHLIKRNTQGRKITFEGVNYLKNIKNNII